METTTLRFRALCNTLLPCSDQFVSLRFSSSQSSCFSSAAVSAVVASKRKGWGFVSDGYEGHEGQSGVYRHTLKFQRPSTIKWRDKLQNSVSFIGTVISPLKIVHCDSSRFGVYTMLNVKTSPNSSNSFRILLKMWGKMAEISYEHLKQHDYIYVSGSLESYGKPNQNGKLKTYYEVIVRELNFVLQSLHGQSKIPGESERSETVDETALEKCRNRLYLWQLFFTSPHEWQDFRKCKKNAKHPDFTCKDTGEALWIRSNDPPWVKRQLKLHDSRLAG